MASDYMPKSFPNLEPWLQGLKDGVTNDGATCNQSPAQIAEDTALIDSMLGPVTTANAKETEALDANGTAQTAITDHRDDLRDLINRYKNAKGWTEGMAAAWDVSTKATQYNMSTQQPSITVRGVPGKNVVSGKKPGFTSVTIQMRVDGVSPWLDIGTKVSQFPFYDTTAPQTPGKPEKREYRALGYVGDTQNGPAQRYRNSGLHELGSSGGVSRERCAAGGPKRKQLF
jgi:hypothetical protein